jgi:hypothetical protein
LNGFLYGSVSRGRLEDQAMDRQLVTWQTAEGERLWLSMLVDAMEEASQHDCSPCEREWPELARLRLQLARPASPYVFGGSAFSLRN